MESGLVCLLTKLFMAEVLQERFGVLIAVTVKISVLWDVIHASL
jgi:hypothetical protein